MEDKNVIQSFNLEALKTSLGIYENTTYPEIQKFFNELQVKMGQDLVGGFSTWVDSRNMDGHCGVCLKGVGGKSKFILRKRILDGKSVRTILSGLYEISGNRVSIDIDQETNSPLVNCRVFLNHNLVANRTSPFDLAAQQSDAFLRTIVETQGDPGRLDKTLKEERSPLPFIGKMLSDYQNSQVDSKETKRMFNKMKESPYVENVVWNRQFRVK